MNNKKNKSGKNSTQLAKAMSIAQNEVRLKIPVFLPKRLRKIKQKELNIWNGKVRDFIKPTLGV